MIFVFAGAGASKAVNPDHYPTTVEFFDQLTAPVTETALFKRLLEYLKARNKGEVLDIERVLWGLGELQDFVKVAKSNRGFPGWLMDKNRLAALVSRPFHGKELITHLEIVGRQADDLASEINKRVYTLYRRIPEGAELEAI